MGAARSVFLAAALLVLAGLYQFSRAKAICHGVCHAPAAYFFGHWRPGPLGGARRGVGLGVYCVGCCWAIMALGFVGGAMNLWWMGLATAFMVIEKLPQVARHVTRPGGAALILAGGLVALHGAGLI
jgi:predicted metal-binding membrane protein